MLRFDPSNVLIEGSSGSTGLTFSLCVFATDSGIHDVVHPVSAMQVSSLLLNGCLSEALLNIWASRGGVGFDFPPTLLDL